MANDFWNFMSAGGAGAAGGLLGGLFGNSGDPYKKAMNEYRQYGQKGIDVQNPFYNAGKGAIGDYQQWLQGQKDPGQFMNNLQSQYQASPYSQYLQRQSMLAGQNAASMGGLPNGMGGAGIGSTPMMQQMQQNAGNIASGDMNQWLQHALGINSQYGQGQQNLMQGGQGAANAMSGIYGNMGNQMGEAAYGRQAGHQQDMWNTIGGLGSLAGMFL